MIEFSPFAKAVFTRTYAKDETETWEACAARVSKAVAFDPNQEQRFFELIRDRIFIPGGRYLYSSAQKIKQYANCFGFVGGDSRESWATLLHDVTMCLSMGGGLGVNYSRVRPNGTPIRRMGGTASGPMALMQMVNEVARHVMAGGKRRSALWAGLNWNHDDVRDFIRIKDWDQPTLQMKALKYEYPAPLDMTNVSVIVGQEYFTKLGERDPDVVRLHSEICDRMLRTGEPGFINMTRRLQDDGQAFTANACTEATLHHNDVCNLGSIVLPSIQSLDHLESVVRTAVQFLMNGSIISEYPTEGIERVARKNRRIGLGIMGLHEYMLLSGHRYEWFADLEDMFKTWAAVSDDEAIKYADRLCEPRPVARRAIAPTGTISIVAETTSGIEPIFCTAYKRRYIDGNVHRHQYVVDPTARRLLDIGVRPGEIEDAYKLSHDLRRRLTVQRAIQQYVDQACSNTINTPGWESNGHQQLRVQDFAALMQEFLPDLKGITVYPNGARPGQPLTPVSLDEALANEGVVFEEEGDRCLGGNTCGV